MHLHLSSISDIADQIGIPKFVLTQYIFQADSYYAVFSINKSNGKRKRRISAPSRGLKGIQKWIYRSVLVNIPEGPGCTAYFKGASLDKNAKVHVGKSFVLNMDLKDFFPTITIKRVAGLFRSIGYSQRVSWALANLTTYKGRLPQGAPSSPKIANLICRQLDDRLSSLCKSFKWNYTRYSDDITISGSGQVHDQVLDTIMEIIESEGFSVNPTKLRVSRRNSRQLVTGLTVNDGVSVPRSSKRRVRAIFHRAKLAPGLFLQRVEELKGYVGFLESITGKSDISKGYREIIKEIERRG